MSVVAIGTAVKIAKNIQENEGKNFLIFFPFNISILPTNIQLKQNLNAFSNLVWVWFLCLMAYQPSWFI